jgi:hypothetical protein
VVKWARLQDAGSSGQFLQQGWLFPYLGLQFRSLRCACHFLSFNKSFDFALFFQHFYHSVYVCLK